MIIKIVYRIFFIKPIAFFGKKCYYVSIKDNRVDSGEYGAVKYGSQCRSYGELNCGRIRKLLCPFRIPLLHIYPRKKGKIRGNYVLRVCFHTEVLFYAKKQKNKRRCASHAHHTHENFRLCYDDSARDNSLPSARLPANGGISG